MHGIIDYTFGAALVGVPLLLSINKDATSTYTKIGLAFTVMNALTDTPVGVKRVITLKGHQKADAAYLTGLSLMALSRSIRKEKRTLWFHISFLALGIINYRLTDYDAVS